jgi:hypothetical protein
MGYRELLKKYVRFLEMYAGDNFMEAIACDPDREFGERDLAELRTLSGEIDRERHATDEVHRNRDFNYRLRLLCCCYGLTPQQTAQFAGVDIATLRRWRTNPRLPRHLVMRDADFLRFERSLVEWLNKHHRVVGVNRI